MGFFNDTITGTVMSAQVVAFNSYRQMNIGFPKETTLITIVDDGGSEHRGYLLGQHGEIVPQMRVTVIFQKTWNAQNVVWNKKVGTVEIESAAPILDPFKMAYRKISGITPLKWQ